MESELGIVPELIAGSGGVFDVFADGKLLFSKHQNGDFPTEAEILRLLRTIP